jgi:hypothetical protein
MLLHEEPLNNSVCQYVGVGRCGRVRSVLVGVCMRFGFRGPRPRAKRCAFVTAPSMEDADNARVRPASVARAVPTTARKPMNAAQSARAEMQRRASSILLEASRTENRTLPERTGGGSACVFGGLSTFVGSIADFSWYVRPRA